MDHRSRIRISLLFLVATVSFAVGSAAQGQYPPMEKIDPFVRSVRETVDIMSVPVVFPANESGWKPVSNVRLAPGDGILNVEATGDDPWFVSPPLDGLARSSSLSLDGTILVRFRVRGPNPFRGSLYWSDRDDPNYAESRHVEFRVQGGDAWQEICVTLEAGSPLTSLRLDPGPGPGRAAFGEITIQKVVYTPLQLTGTTSVQDQLDLEWTSSSDTPLAVTLTNASEGHSLFTRTISAHGVDREHWVFPKKEPFEHVVLAWTTGNPDEKLTREFYAFHEDLETNWIRLTDGRRDVLLDPQGQGAVLRLDGQVRAALYPLAQSVSGDHALSGLEELAGSPFYVTGGEVTVESDHAALVRLRTSASPDGSGETGTIPIRIQLDEELLTFHLDSDVAAMGPVLHVPGTMDQAVFCGLEYLEKGENSSSRADLETADRFRFAPASFCVTWPFLSIETDVAGVSLLYDQPLGRPIFAVPNFMEGRLSEHYMSVAGKGISGAIRVTDPEPLEDAILWGVTRFGLPDLPPNRPLAEQKELDLKAFTDSTITTSDGWRHAAATPPGKQTFAPLWGSDFFSTIHGLTGQLPSENAMVFGGGHIHDFTSWEVAGRTEELNRILDGQAADLRAKQREDGSFRCEGKYLKGHWDTTASGYTANYLYTLLIDWQTTGNKDSLSAALRGLNFVNRLKTPRGAQTWELSLHTPDIMGSSRCVLANIMAYEATGEESYRVAARRWALTGLPFVYLWDGPWTEKEPGVMRYATIAVFGATDWAAPNWIGRPVQWCGLDYAHALFLLAPHDQTLDWHRIAEGIVRCGQREQYTSGTQIGLLPDSWDLTSEEPFGPDINPSALYYLRSRFMTE